MKYKNLYFEKSYIVPYTGENMTVVIDGSLECFTQNKRVVVFPDGRIKGDITLLDYFYKILPKVQEDIEEYENQYKLDADGDLVYVG